MIDASGLTMILQRNFGVIQRQIKDITLVGGFKTYTNQFQLLCIAFGNPFNHIVYQ